MEVFVVLWGVFLVPRGTILDSFWCLGKPFGLTLGIVAVPLAPRAPEESRGMNK